MLRLIIGLITLTMLASCQSSEDSFYAQTSPQLSNNGQKPIDLPDYLTDIGTINISMLANGNYSGIFDNSYIKNIEGVNNSYCHPDVEYFPNGFHGYKYWMVFTPYFGSVGITHESIRFENPSVVVSNDGINWISPVGILNPLQSTPTPQESFVEKKGEKKQGFWSDVDWVYVNNKFYLYYRGSFVTAEALKNRGAKSQNNKMKLQNNAMRSIVRQTSTDGIHWTPLEAVINSNAPYTPNNNLLVSPSIVHNGTNYVSYEVDNNTGKANFKGDDGSYIVSRTSPDGLNFSNFTKSKIVNFSSKPWAKVDATYSPWHIQATYVDGYYFLMIAAGPVKNSTAECLYLAFSKDGVNFSVFPKAIVEHNVYRSAIFPMKTDATSIKFGAIIGFKSGVFKYREFAVTKQKLDQLL